MVLMSFKIEFKIKTCKKCLYTNDEIINKNPIIIIGPMIKLTKRFVMKNIIPNVLNICIIIGAITICADMLTANVS